MRCDGKRLKMPPYSQIAPYLMNRRCDSYNNARVDLDIDPISEYLASLPADQPPVSYMSLLIAGYIRALRKYPQVNRFIRGKHYYQRTEITVSFVMLKSRDSAGNYEETLIKLKFEPDDTLFTVGEKVNKAIEANKDPSAANITDKLLAWVMKISPLVSFIVGIAKVLDYLGCCPKFIVEGSPFHSGLFITNLMSIRGPQVFHHLYEFGTNSLFVSMGNAERKLELKDDKAVEKRVVPLGVTVDERVCAGYEFVCFLREWESYMRKPKRLETLE